MQNEWEGNELGKIVAHCANSVEGRRDNNALMATRGIYKYAYIYIYLLERTYS